MKIAVSAEGTDLGTKVSYQFGTSQYLLIIETDSMDLEVIPNPGSNHGEGRGIQAVVLAISKEVQAVITGYLSPTAQKYLFQNGIKVTKHATGTVGEVVEKYKKDLLEQPLAHVPPEQANIKINSETLFVALISTGKQFLSLLPILVGVLFLIGFFNVFVSKEVISSLFSGNAATDTFWGACFGSILAGNPINSYILGGEFLANGVSLWAVTAFIVAWVNVGFVHLPLEMGALGKKFAILRNGLSFIFSIIIALLTVSALRAITG